MAPLGLPGTFRMMDLLAYPADTAAEARPAEFFLEPSARIALGHAFEQNARRWYASPQE